MQASVKYMCCKDASFSDCLICISFREDPDILIYDLDVLTLRFNCDVIRKSKNYHKLFKIICESLSQNSGQLEKDGWTMDTSEFRNTRLFIVYNCV